MLCFQKVDCKTQIYIIIIIFLEIFGEEDTQMADDTVMMGKMEPINSILQSQSFVDFGLWEIVDPSERIHPSIPTCVFKENLENTNCIFYRNIYVMNIQ